MLRTFRSIGRLTRAARILGRHDALMPLELRAEMPPLLLALLPLAKIRFPWEAPPQEIAGNVGERLATALAALGPSYIKLGQFLATRPDIIGAELANDLTSLQDKLPPFSMAEARAIIEEGIGKPVEQLFSAFSEPIAAASIAQVHHARTLPEDEQTEGRDVAVKVLRPGIETRFAADLDSFSGPPKRSSASTRRRGGSARSRSFRRWPTA